MAAERRHFSDLMAYHAFLGLSVPEHPLFSVVSVSSSAANEVSCAGGDIVLSTDFYSISLKHITSGAIFYGRTKYDYRKGAMIFMAPKQEFRLVGLNVEATGYSIVFHEDFIRGHKIKDEIRRYSYFGYAVNEALHLSREEFQVMQTMMCHIESEYRTDLDSFSKDLLLSQVDTLLRYANRFYHRQFLRRKEISSDMQLRFLAEVEHFISENRLEDKRIPTIEDIARVMCMSPRYLSDALKVETGKTALENLHLHLIDRAKDMLLDSDVSVATVAYGLGFEYPQYFARLFKKKTGMTPTEYRQSYHCV